MSFEGGTLGSNVKTILLDGALRWFAADVVAVKETTIDPMPAFSRGSPQAPGPVLSQLDRARVLVPLLRSPGVSPCHRCPVIAPKTYESDFRD